MKRNYFFRLVLLLFAVILGQSVKAQTFSGGTGTETDPYQIASLDDWNTLAYAIVGNSDQAAFAGKFFKMTANIGTTAEPVTTPLGKQTGSGHDTRKRFAGIFDGDGHTLTVNINNTNNPWYANNASYCAPFAYAQNITIRNLTVLGTITTTGQFASGLVGQTGPDGDKTKGTCVIENCHVGATFVGNTTGNNTNGNHGIFVSVAEGNVTITNSWFDGIIDGKNYYYSGGFIGLNKATATLTDCLFNPTSIGSDVNYKQSSEFSHDISGTSKLTRCYYTKSFSDPETAQGQRVKIGVVVDNDDYRYSYTTIEDDNGNVLYKTPDGENYYIVKENCIWTRIQTDYINTAENSYSLGDVSDERLIEGKLVAGKDNVAFVIPAGKTFTLDLGGKTIDRDLDVVNPAPADVDGFVIKVEAGAKLTITNGTIQHGHHRSNGGCIYNEGELILDGVTLTKNYADGNGSGAGIYNAGTLCLNNNVTITDNHLKSDGTGTGAGVYNTSDASLHISGKVLVNTGNKKGTQDNNLFLAGSSVITVDAAIKGTSIGVMKETNGVFTKGLKNKGTVSNFKSNANNIFVALYSEGANEGEAYLYGLETIDLYNNPTDVTNVSVITPYNGLHVNVKLNNRTLYKDGYWNTICLPFKTSKSGPLKDAEVRKLKSATIDEAGILNITFEAVSTLNAGTPYLIRWTKPEGYDQNPDNFDVKNPTFSNVVIENTTPVSVTTNAITFRGIYDPTPLSNDRSVLVMGAENTLTYPTNANYKLRAFRGYFEVNGAGSEIKAFEMNFEDEDDPTSIRTTYSVQSPMNDAIYNLAGQRMGKMQRGINIVNGKKVFIK
ncbi:MAG: hypothetical protein IKW91_00200 [Bacteroidaceae bacterium]|nr:hypothetical protein [Bacteroidaceae bacterium]